MSILLNSNDDLYQYLLVLSEEFKRQGKMEIADKIIVVSRFAFGSASEFFYESESILRSIQKECSGMLTESQLDDIAGVIKQIESAFGRIGGA